MDIRQTAGSDPAPTKGFLKEAFRLFHIRDQRSFSYETHCHDFHKIMILINGNVNYVVEGRSYHLSPLDFVLVGRGQLHRPEVDAASPYERILLYLHPDFLAASENAGLDACFHTASYRHSSVLRFSEEKRQLLFSLIKRLEQSIEQEKEAFAGPLYSKLLCMEFLVELNRFCLLPDSLYLTSGSLDYRVSGLISYINDNLADDLSIPLLADVCCLSPYHMMRLFKAQTGTTLGQYICRKRLSKARELLLQGAKATDTCFACGFKDYSSFLRAYKKQYGERPKRGL